MEWTGMWADLPESRRDQLCQIAEAWGMDVSDLAGRVLANFARRLSEPAEARGGPSDRGRQTEPLFPESAGEIDLSPNENGVEA